MKKYLNACKQCKKEFETIKEDKAFCCSNHKKIYERVPPTKIEYTCECCEKLFYSYKKNVRTCSRKCISKLQNENLRAKKYMEHEEKYMDVEDIPTCKVCGYKSTSLQTHLINHNLTVKQYKDKFNVTNDEVFHSTYINDLSDRIKGNKNPAYNHGGKLSPFSDKFIKYERLNGIERQLKKDEVVKKLHTTQKNNGNYTTTIDYYLNKGMNIEEAQRALFERQSTFSLDICISKHGKKRGTTVWQARQDKWLKTLDELPEEEKLRILKAKTAPLNAKYSQISKELFDSLGVPNSYYAEDELPIETESGTYKPDYVHENKIIEFYGDFWHANPNKYNIDSEIRFPKRVRGKPRTVKNIWKRDKFKIDMLKNSGYETMVVWEQDYHNNKDGVVKQCLEFLHN